MHVYAFVGVEEEASTDNESILLQQHNEARSFVAQADYSDPDWRKAFRLQPGERRGVVVVPSEVSERGRYCSGRRRGV
jgi:hypothetical protein